MPGIQTYEQIVAALCRLAADQVSVDVSTVSLETRFVEDLGYDSLDATEFTMRMEDAFEVAIPDEVAQRAQTVGDALRLLQQAMANTTR